MFVFFNQPFVDIFLSFIGLFCHPPSRETNQMQLCKGEQSSENYHNCYIYSFAYVRFPLASESFGAAGHLKSGGYTVNVIVLSHLVFI